MFAVTLLPSGKDNAGGQPLHVPFPRCVQRLVKIIDVKNQPPLRGTESAKIAYVAIAASLNL